MLYTDLKNQTQYTAQIHPLGGKVMVEIICKDLYDQKLDLYLCVCHKSFGSIWNSAPSQKDWQKANAWVNQQLDLIQKYGTVIVTKPQYLHDK